jgi:hypothetical protein
MSKKGGVSRDDALPGVRRKLSRHLLQSDENAMSVLRRKLYFEYSEHSAQLMQIRI